MRRSLMILILIAVAAAGVVLFLRTGPKPPPFGFLRGHEPFAMPGAGPALGDMDAQSAFYSFKGDFRRFLPQATAELGAEGFFQVPDRPGPKSILFLRKASGGKDDRPLRVVIYQDLHLGPNSAVRPGANPGWITVEVLMPKG